METILFIFGLATASISGTEPKAVKRPPVEADKPKGKTPSTSRYDKSRRRRPVVYDPQLFIRNDLVVQPDGTIRRHQRYFDRPRSEEQSTSTFPLRRAKLVQNSESEPDMPDTADWGIRDDTPPAAWVLIGFAICGVLVWCGARLRG